MNVSKDSDGGSSDLVVQRKCQRLWMFHARPLSIVAMNVLLCAFGCSSASNAEIKGDAAVAGTGGNGTDAAVAATGGVAGGTGGAGGAPAGACPVRTSMTLAQLTVMNASWAGSTATSAGTGKIYIWDLVKLTANGNQLSGQNHPCGSVLPEFSLTGAGQLVTGGTKVLVEFPNVIWDAPGIPSFPTSGSLSGSGWQPGSMLTNDEGVALVGLTLADPRATWPASYTAVSPVDADGDSKAGISAVPRNGGGFVLPPTGLGLLGSAPSADQIYLATRTTINIAGKFDTCTDLSGTATVPFFDNHVVGCHVRAGADCMASQTDFLDQSRTIYQVGSATFAAKQVADNATCEQVRTALPMPMM